MCVQATEAVQIRSEKEMLVLEEEIKDLSNQRDDFKKRCVPKCV